MGVKSSIGWTDSTWNPIRGCSMAKGSEAKGCLNCYAARLNARNLPEMKSPTTGEPFARILESGPRWTGKVELIEKSLTLPLKWKKPKRIFVNSLSDLFHEGLTDERIDRVFAVMALCPQHTFQVLTKRPERMLEYLSSVPLNSGPLPNLWLGVSCEDQDTASARIPLLLQTPAAVRFVSYEPALGPVDFTRLSDGRINSLNGVHVTGENVAGEKLDWIIVGGESGPGARPFDIQWARSTIAQCKAAGVACFVKQLGAKPFGWKFPHLPDSDISPLKDRKGGDPLEWPEELRVQEFPEVASAARV